MPTVVSVFGVKPSRVGGTEMFARELSSQLAHEGWNSVICFLAEPPEEVRSFLNAPNTTLEVFDNSASLSWQSTRRLARILNRHRPDILHLHFTGFLGTYPWLARLKSVKKVMFTDHSSRPTGYSPQPATLLKRLAARVINWPMTKVICVSQYGYRCMTALEMLPKARYELVYNGVDLSRVIPDEDRARRFRLKYSIPEGRLIVVQVSWMIPEKGIADLLEAARLVVDHNNNVQFVLVGEGSSRDSFMKQARNLNLDGYVTWTGQVQDPFNEGVYDAADIVCQVSRWEEVFGWMIAEAMAYGKPVIATRVGGIPELVEDGESGFLVERGDTAAVAEKILILADDSQLRYRMGTAGLRIAASKFELRQNVSELIKLYETVRRG